MQLWYNRRIASHLIRRKIWKKKKKKRTRRVYALMGIQPFRSFLELWIVNEVLTIALSQLRKLSLCRNFSTSY